MVTEPMAHGNDSKNSQDISTSWLTHLTQLLLVVRTVATMLVLGLTTLFVIKTLMHAHWLASSTVEKVNTGAQATAVFIGILYVQKVAVRTFLAGEGPGFSMRRKDWCYVGGSLLGP